MQTTTLTINEPRLQQAIITVHAQSRAEITLYTPTDGGNTWYALKLDGRYHNLIMWKHTIGRDEAIEALDRALAQVQQAIAALAPPTLPAAALVAAALERMADESARSARAAVTDDDRAFFLATADAYTEALAAWRGGAYPQRTPSGGWLVPDEELHVLILDGEWICGCGATGPHWPALLIVGMEVALYDAERFDDYGETAVSVDEPPLRPIGERIAAARAEVLRRAA